MSPYEASRVVADWRRLYVRGEPHQIDQLCTRMGEFAARTGWTQAVAIGAYCNPSACFPDTATGSLLSYERASQTPSVRLFLNRCPRRLRGDRYQAGSGRPVGLPVIADEVGRFRTEVLAPSLAATGLAVVPMDLPRSVVTTDLLDRLITLTEVAGFVYPLCEPSADLWREFVLACQFGGAAFDPDELTRWFVRLGWAEADGRRLTDDFYQHSRLLRAYEIARFGPPPGSGTTTTPPPWQSPALQR